MCEKLNEGDIDLSGKYRVNINGDITLPEAVTRILLGWPEGFRPKIIVNNITKSIRMFAPVKDESCQ